MNVIVVGGGQVGTYITNILLDSNCNVKLIENREKVLEKLRKELPENVIYEGSGSDPSVLETCGVMSADVVAAVTGLDETNLVVSTIAKFEFNVPRVIARLNNPKNAWLFNAEMGVDVCLNQADLMAHLVVEEMDLKNILTLLQLDRGEYSIIQVTVDKKSSAVGKTIKELTIPAKAILISIFRDKDVIIPRGDTVIAAGDKILAFGNIVTHGDINDLFNARIS